MHHSFIRTTDNQECCLNLRGRYLFGLPKFANIAQPNVMTVGHALKLPMETNCDWASWGRLNGQLVRIMMKLYQPESHWPCIWIFFGGADCGVHRAGVRSVVTCNSDRVEYYKILRYTYIIFVEGKEGWVIIWSDARPWIWLQWTEQ